MIQVTTPLRTADGQLAVPVNNRDHVMGPVNAPVTLVEYGDYQCPFCGMAHPIVQDLLRRRMGMLRFVYRHFPLANIHPHAETAAEAAEAADVRHRFWEVHNWLFGNQDQLEPVSLIAGLVELGLDGGALSREMSAHKYLDKVRFDFIGGVRSGVNGTPTFYLNGVRHDGGYSLPELESAVDRAVETSRL
jgi:protein-disulfide isomerase